MHTSTPSILIFGATGGTGKHLVQQALSAGHQVTAFVRSPHKLHLEHEHLRVIVGDVSNPAQVGEATKDHDAVFSTLGAPAGARTQIRTIGTRHIVQAMRDAGISRLISLSSHGIAETRQTLPWFMKAIVVPLYLRRAFDDHERQEAAIRGSGLSWTIVRPPHLTDGPRSTEVLHTDSYDPNMGTKISRADVAAFMLQQLAEDRYVQAAPMIWS